MLWSSLIFHTALLSETHHLVLLSPRSDLEKVQKFALPMCTYTWSANYLDLLSNLQFLSLSTCRSQSEIFIIYKILNNLIYFPPKILFVSPLQSDPPAHIIPWMFLLHIVDFCSLNSFVPSVSSDSLWSSFPHHLKISPSFPQFKSSLKLSNLNLYSYLNFSLINFHLSCIYVMVLFICYLSIFTKQKKIFI